MCSKLAAPLAYLDNDNHRLTSTIKIRLYVVANSKNGSREYPQSVLAVEYCYLRLWKLLHNRLCSDLPACDSQS